MGNVAVAGPQTVVAGAGMIHLPGQRWWATNAQHVGQLVEGCAGADVVLVHGDAHNGWRLPEQLPKEGKREHPFITGAIDAGWEVEPRELGRWLKVRRGGAWTSVLFLRWDREDGEPVATPWSDLERLQDVVRGLARFEVTVGLPWRDSVGRTVERLILSTHPRERGGVLMDRRPIVPEPALVGTLEQPMTWRRPLVDEELARAYVHAYDQNAQYLGAWQSVELGIGEPEHRSPTLFDPKVAGIWRLAEGVQTVLASVDWGLLPPPANLRNEWFTTPTMTRIAEVLEEAPLVSEAWVWPRHSRFLRAAGERLRDARAQLLQEASMDPAGAAALDAVKACYRRQTGRLNMNRDGRERSSWHRPDWGHAIRAQARVNLHRRLAGTPGGRGPLGAVPFAIATDGLLFATDVDSPMAFAAEIGLPVGPGLGQFSLKGSWKMTPERVEALAAAASTAATYKLLRSWGVDS